MQTEEKMSLFSKEKKIQLESLVKISSKLLEKITASLESHSQKQSFKCGGKIKRLLEKFNSPLTKFQQKNSLRK